MSTGKITVQTRVAAQPGKVWEYYTNPQHITKWNFASDDWHCPSAENDMQVGGKYRSRMEAKDGSFGFDFEASYNEIAPGEQFTYTMSDGRQAQVQFKPADGQTDVLVSFDPEQQNDLEMQRGGWQAILDNFRKYTESN